MTYVIAAPCIDHMDKTCVDVCPVDCISSEPGIDNKFFIDPDGCIECGSCATSCPNDAIFESGDLPARYAAFVQIDATWFHDRAQARGMLDVTMAATPTH